MSFTNECKEYLSYLKKYMYIILSLYILCEVAIFIKIGRSNVFMFASTIFVTLFIICSIILCFKNFETTIKMYILSVPLIPLILYIFFRLKMTWIGTSMYWLYFLIFIINAYKAFQNNKLDFSKISLKNGRYKKVVLVYLVLIVLSFISAMLSIHKLESLNMMGVSLVSMAVISLLILSYKDTDKEFVKDIIAYLCGGVALSSIPDIIVALYTIIFQGKNQHLYGVLGSNFMLGYTIIVLPFILLFAINKDICPKYNKIFKLLLIIETVNLCTQMSRGILVAVFICFFLTIILDRKNFIKYLLVAAIIFSGLGYNIMHRWELNEIRQEIEVEGIGGVVQGPGFLKQVLDQTKSRRPIWIVAFRMIGDNPYFGVGPGQFKNNYLDYGGKPTRMYIDAHNIVLNVATEMGVIFTVIFFIACLFPFFKSLIHGWKYKKTMGVLYPSLIGISALFAYGNITGQAFMTSTYPVSIVPAFVFVMTYTIMIKTTKEYK
ncbi:O-antigen ligase family protein [Clostridium brassicae]|uniref:O-antigen ligase family protein n=1 Tax=Clostridium brassicae TaxID=2999072 RepID=A0ABT4DAD0_9CLOT|nr:O-antigen ligase family protein [Clostridium brassicae]MCY6958623.1 O-antigen ligase family protein [Clostridium brassicae]